MRTLALHYLPHNNTHIQHSAHYAITSITLSIAATWSLQFTVTALSPHTPVSHLKIQWTGTSSPAEVHTCITLRARGESRNWGEYSCKSNETRMQRWAWLCGVMGMYVCICIHVCVCVFACMDMLLLVNRYMHIWLHCKIEAKIH